MRMITLTDTLTVSTMADSLAALAVPAFAEAPSTARVSVGAAADGAAAVADTAEAQAGVQMSTRGRDVVSPVCAIFRHVRSVLLTPP
jgi:cytochrome c5